ncbi:MAG: DUF4214 domain-containing protein [Sphingomonadales bacterium]|nr:DUF4214 domain-containing protein [Sphingomonadales bacterium]
MASTSFVTKAYLAYFGRPVDFDGMTAWGPASGASEADIQAGFSAAPETAAIYGSTIVNLNYINNVYLNLFNREAEPAGASYWLQQIQLGRVTPVGAAMAILDGALGNDKIISNNKIAASAAFTADMTTTEQNLGYANGLPAARSFIQSVDLIPATSAEIDAAVLAATSNVPQNASGQTFVLTPGPVADATGIMHITGDQAVRIDFTNPANQVKGLDLNGNGVIQTNGLENTITGVAANFTIVDAYARAPLNTTNITDNYLGNISFDGTGYAGDGVSTDGNIFLGGLGADYALGGIGNDFMVGGGVAQDRYIQDDLYGGYLDTLTQQRLDAIPTDYLQSGRNADFFFGEFSVLDNTDGNNSDYDGGNTTDDSSAGLAQALSGVNSQNNDWFLLEASDDDEPVSVQLGDGGVTTRSGAHATLTDIESLDASGNLYGFLNDIAVEVGARATDSRSVAPVVGTENYGFGSTAQLNIYGSDAANVIIGGYDNDSISGGEGNDILFGGNLSFLLNYQNNPNLLNATGGLSLNNTLGVDTDGRDELSGGIGNDSIVFEMDGGSIVMAVSIPQPKVVPP